MTARDAGARVAGASVCVLVCDPGMGSLWLYDVEWTPDSVQGWAWDDSDAGSAYMPDDFHGDQEWMNFPLSCVLKVHIDGTRERA